MSSAPALLRLKDFAALRVSGADRIDFLQGQLSQDMRKVTADRAAPAAWCNRQGRVICLMAALEWDDATYLVLPAEMSATCAEGLGRFVLRAKVRIEPSALPVFGCVNADRLLPAPGRQEQGMSSLSPLQAQDASATGEAGAAGAAGGASAPEDAPAAEQAWACGGGSGYRAARLPGKENRALLLGSPPDETGGALADSGWTTERWRLADIEAEIPWIVPRTTEQFLAHSLNLDLSGAVSFAKGCYVGQEIIARMEHRGKPKRRMRRLRLPLNAAALPGAKLRHPELGAITIISAAADGDGISALAEARLS